jgi:hypothetical protein
MAWRFPNGRNPWHCSCILDRFDQNFEWSNGKGIAGSNLLYRRDRTLPTRRQMASNDTLGAVSIISAAVALMLP